jgi:ATP-dependent helicase IRC3
MMFENLTHKGIMKLRPYQIEAQEAIFKEFQEKDRQYIVMPTGSGKTITFLSFAKQHYTYILIVVPSRELLKQVYETALMLWEPWEISRKGAGFNEELSRVHICIINSIKGKYLDEIRTGEFNCLIIDEAHHSQANSYRRMIDTLVATQFCPLHILGVTATPDRADGKALDELLWKRTFEVDIETLILQGHLCDIEGFAVRTNCDLSDIDDHNGDFSINQLYKKLSTDARNGLIIKTYLDEMQHKKSLIFCINVKHSLEIAQLLYEKGVIARAIYGDMNEAEKQSTLKGFREGQISVLCNCQLLTEGFDEPAIDGIILARPTRSKALFMQMIGRGLRIYPGKENCKIVDIVDTHRALAGFANLLEEGNFRGLDSFSGIKSLRNHVDREIFDQIETSIKRVNFFDNEIIEEMEPTYNMLQYLQQNQIYYDNNINFDEASFLIWFNELQKEYKNGINTRT